MSTRPDTSFSAFAELAAAASELPPELSDTDTDDSVVSTTRSHPSSPRPGRRAVHNVCERRRRQSIRDAFAALQARVYPDTDGKKTVSKMEVLRGAVELIERTRKEVDLLVAASATRRCDND